MNIHCSPGYAPGIPLTAVGFNPGNILRDVTCLDWRSWCYDASGPWCLWPTESSYMPRTELLFMPCLPIVRYVWMHFQATDATGTNNEALPLSQRIFSVSTHSQQKDAKGRLRLPVLPMVPLGPSAPRPHPERTTNEVPACGAAKQRINRWTLQYPSVTDQRCGQGTSCRVNF